MRETAAEASGDTRAGVPRQGRRCSAAACSARARCSAPRGTRRRREPQGRHRDPQLRAHARVPRGRLLHRGGAHGRAARRARAVRDVVGAHERAHVKALKAALGRKAVKKPGSTSRARRRTRRSSPRPRRRSRTPACPPTRARRRASRPTTILARRAGDPHGRGTPRELDPRLQRRRAGPGRLRQAAHEEARPGDRRLHRLHRLSTAGIRCAALRGGAAGRAPAATSSDAQSATPGREVAERAGDEPGGEPGAHAALRYRGRRPWPTDRLHHRHRAARVARARRGRGARRRGREARRPGRAARSAATCASPASAPARRPPPVDHPARRPRGRARRGRARVDRRLVLGRDRRARRSSRSASRTSTSATCPARASRCASRSRSACARRPTLGDYKGLEVGRREPEVADEAIDAEIEQLRERIGQARDRRARRRERRLRGHGLRRHARRRAVRRRRGPRPDGRARLRPARARLRGAARRAPPPARSARSRSTFPDDYGAEELAGQEAEFAVTVKEVKAKELPAARRRPRRRGRLRHARRAARRHPRAPRRGARSAQIEAEFREAALDAAVADATVEVPDALVEARVARAVGPDAPLALAPGHLEARPTCGSPAASEDEIVDEGKRRRRAARSPRGRARRDRRGRGHRADRGGGARGARAAPPRREAALAEEAARAAAVGRPPRRAQGGPRAAQGARPLAESAKPISVEQAQARDKLWTPGRRGAESGSGSSGPRVLSRLTGRPAPGRLLDSPPAAASSAAVKDSSARSETKRGP